MACTGTYRGPGSAPGLSLPSARGTVHAGRLCMLQVTFKGNGPIDNVMVVASSQGTVKGRVGNPDADPPLREDGKLNVGAAVGQGRHACMYSVLPPVGPPILNVNGACVYEPSARPRGCRIQHGVVSGIAPRHAGSTARSCHVCACVGWCAGLHCCAALHAWPILRRARPCLHLQLQLRHAQASLRWCAATATPTPCPTPAWCPSSAARSRRT